jgi:hypothetical protein
MGVTIHIIGPKDSIMVLEYWLDRVCMFEDGACWKLSNKEEREHRRSWRIEGYNIKVWRAIDLIHLLKTLCQTRICAISLFKVNSMKAAIETNMTWIATSIFYNPSKSHHMLFTFCT